MEKGIELGRYNVGVRPKFIQPAKGCIDEMLQLIEMAPTQLQVATQFVNQNIYVE